MARVPSELEPGGPDFKVVGAGNVREEPDRQFVTTVERGQIDITRSVDSDVFSEIWTDYDYNVIAYRDPEGVEVSPTTERITAQVDALFRVEQVESDVFTEITTDEDYNVFSFRGLDYVEVSPTTEALQQSGGSPAAASDYVDSDAFEEIETDAAGNVLRYRRKYGTEQVEWQPPENGGFKPPLADIVRPSGDVLFLPVYGQSVFTGPGTTPISTAPVAGLKMFNGGSGGFDYSNAANLTSLPDLVESGDERASRGVGESFLQFWEAEAGYDLVDAGVSLVLTTAAEGGKSAAELMDGGAYFPRLKQSIDALAAIAAADGNVPDILPLVYCQGEQDISIGTAPEARRDTIEKHIRQPLESYARSVFKRPTRIVMVTTQEASHLYYNKADPAIARMDLQVANEDPNYILAGAMYQFEYGNPTAGSHLWDADEVKWAAAMAGRAAQRVARGVEHKWMRPVRGYKPAARTLLIEYDVPVEPIVIDTVNVSASASNVAGYNVYVADVEQAVSSVSVFGRRGIRIAMTGDLPAGRVRIDYAHTGGALAAAAGRTTGARGNVRDSDPAIFDPAGLNKPLYNWLPISRIFID